MSTAVQISTPRSVATAMSTAQLSDKALGILFASIVPALFWTAMLALVGGAFGQSLSLATLVTVGGSITAFLALIVGSLVARQG